MYCIEQYGFVDGLDFSTIFLKSVCRPAIKYFLTLDLAKELSMVERNEQGKRVRQYFIECERRKLQGAQISTKAVLLVLRFFGKFTPPHEET